MEPFTLVVLRADDLLDLSIELHNLRVEQRPGGAVLVRADPAAAAFLIAVLPPQHVGEEAFPDALGTPTPPFPPIRASLSGPTRLAFRIPQSMSELPLTLDALLDWRRLEPSLAANAFPSGSSPLGPPAEPPPTATAIEAPYRLFLSPLPLGRWAHAVAPVTHAGWTELWHTRLTGRDIDLGGPAAGRALRAIWTPDLDAPESEVLTALSPADRRDIVHASGDFFDPRSQAVTIASDGLMLSARGAWLELAAAWPLPSAPHPGFDLDEVHRLVAMAIEQAALGDRPIEFVRDEFMHDFIRNVPAEQQQPLQLAILHALSQFPDNVGSFASDWLAELPVIEAPRAEWSHRAAQGRDTNVRITRPGYLFPLGHRTTFVRTTERVLQPAPDGGLTAYLRQRSFLVVNEPFRDYRALGPVYRHEGRESPFLSARIVNLTTPSLDPGADEHTLFWPRVGGADVQWTVLFADREGRPVELSMPLLFMPAVDTEGSRFDEGQALTAYRRGRRQVAAAGQEVAFADGRPGKPGEAVLAAQSLLFDAQAGNDLGTGQLLPGQPRFLPTLEAAAVRIPAVDALLGSARAAAGTPISYDLDYLASAFDETMNKGQLFARIEPLVSLAFDAERAGGLARPNLDVGALSRTLGPVADRDNIVRGVFDAAKFLPDAKILGGLSLKSLLAPLLTGIAPQELPELAGLDPDQLWHKLTTEATAIKVPAFTNRTLRDAGVPKAVETRYVWKPALLSGPIPGAPFLALAPGAHLVLATTLRAQLDGSAPVFESRGELADFALDFAGVVRVELGRLGFAARSGRKLDVTAEGVSLTFMGDLEFVNEIQKFIPADGFSDPPAVSVSPTGIEASYSLGLPTIGVGVFSLQNLALSAALTLPFVDQPARLRFALSERHDPFLVTVSLFGGGGFFALGVAAGGELDVEAAIEFGGNFSLDIVVASGGVHVMAGIYFKLAGSRVTLSGYLRAGGALTVLGLITISVEFYLSLTYGETERGNKVWGEASLTVGVEVLFFSTEVTLHVRRQFAGAAGDPTFEDLLEPADWDSYCKAFAA